MKVDGSFTGDFIKDNLPDCYQVASLELINHSAPGACVKSGIIYVNTEKVIWYFTKL